MAFNPNDYRKRVLAQIERKGGIEHSDPFELYDIPLDEADTLSDAEVAAQVAEVWGFWQRQRDHPKYRVLAGLLVAAHPALSELVLVAGARRAEAVRVRETRARRDADRYDILDTAISRLVQRYGGVPAGKVAGLTEIGAMGGLSPAEVATRMRRHRVIADAEPTPAAPSVLTDQRRRQIRQLLDEWERLLDGPPTPTLFALLGVDSRTGGQANEIRLRAEALRARSRELPPGRVRVVLDELLIHVHDVLESGDSAVREYLSAVAEDVAGELRPKVKAAVLVEDQLVGADFQYLVDEAVALGLDRADATRLLTDLATELGARVEDSARSLPAAQPGSSPGMTAPQGRTVSRGSTESLGGAVSPGRTASSSTAARRRWEAPLKAARAALRAGRPAEAARQVVEARRLLGADDDGLTPIRSVADEVDRVLVEAAVRWRGAISACAAKRYVEAIPHLEFLQRTASDVPPPEQGRTLDELLVEARAAIAEADHLATAAQAGPAEARLRGALDAKAVCADHAGAAAALEASPVEAPARVEATRTSNGSILVVWSPSSTGTVDYRVTRLQPDGSWRVVGRTKATELEDGGAPTGPPPVYAVAAAVAGKYSEITRSDTASSTTPHRIENSPKPSGEHQLPAPTPLDNSTPTQAVPTPAPDNLEPSRSAAGPAPDDGRHPQSDGERPARDGALPSSGGERPARDAALPSSGGERPARAGALPSGDGERPARDGVLPLGGGALPSGDGEYPERDLGHSQGGGMLSQGDGPERSGSEGDGPTPSGGGGDPESSRDQSYARGVPSQGDGECPGGGGRRQSAGASPSGGASSPVDGASPQGGGNPVGDRGGSQSDEVPSRGGYSERGRGDLPVDDVPSRGDGANPGGLGGRRQSAAVPPPDAAGHPERNRGHSQNDRAPAQNDRADRRDDPAPAGIPTVTRLAEQSGLLVFAWPTGITEVMIVARADEPPTAPDDPQARAWKVTNMRYEIDGGVRIPGDINRPCHIAIASCRRDPTGKLTIAPDFAATARISWER
ncbi:hypothetical protein ACLMAJ_32830 [Nocardia sp. KC 131]|uniref:hypothetical protein n=1 Tax=Nocardia arseniciresistens TaxID=3392119 RepID=UPI00398F8A58